MALNLKIVGFVAIYLCAGVVVLLQRIRNNSGEKYRARYILFLLGILILANVSGVILAPATHMHKYSTAADRHEVHHEIYLVDTNKADMRLDPRAIEPIGPSTDFKIKLLQSSGTERRAYAKFIIRESAEYRQKVESTDPIISASITASFPPETESYHWSQERLQNHTQFIGIRVYEVERAYTESDPYDVSYENRTVVMRVRLSAESINV